MKIKSIEIISGCTPCNKHTYENREIKKLKVCDGSNYCDKCGAELYRYSDGTEDLGVNKLKIRFDNDKIRIVTIDEFKRLIDKCQ